MKKLYCIETDNRFNQILIFTSLTDAVRWAKKATRWTKEEIEKNIRIVQKNRLGCFDVFPNI